MASPPSAHSPPGPSPLALPRQRLALALPGGAPSKKRKPSIASNNSSAHPLRQTSFPPESNYLGSQHQEALARYSPSQASHGSPDDFSDSELVSAISGPAGAGEDGPPRKRKRGEKRTRGRGGRQSTARAGSTSLINGEDGTPARRVATSPDHGDEEDDDDEEEDGTGVGGGRVPLYEGGQMSAVEFDTDAKQKAMFRQLLHTVDRQPITEPGREGIIYRDMVDRYDTYGRTSLRKPDVRKLVNQTLSQSVPANVVTVVSTYTKTFAGMLLEEARKVQAEWMAAEEKRADGERNSAFERLKKMRQHNAVVDSQASKENTNGTNGHVKVEQSSSPTLAGSQADVPSSENTLNGESAVRTCGAGGLSSVIEECDRGPLQPDHLREALRRYKKSRKGGGVGYTGLSLEGQQSTAPRLGGRRLFR